jgi:HD-GYP domain-containing protein (c-di-GMP phosphodiesterase class II)/HAMP domain-containing protein
MAKQQPEPLHTIITRLLFTQQVLVTAMITMLFAISSHWSAKIAVQQARDSTYLIANSVGEYLDSTEHALVGLSSSIPTQFDLDSIRAGYNEFDVIYYILPNGRLEKISPRTGLVTVGMDMSAQPYFSPKQEQLQLSSPFTSTRTGKPTVYMSLALQRGEGLIVGEMNLSQLQNRLIKKVTFTTGSSFIIDRDGFFVAHPDSNQVARHESIRGTAIHQAALAGEQEPIYTWNDLFYVTLIEPIPETGWFVINQFPVWTVYGPFLIPGVIGMIVAIGLFFVSMRQQRRTIARRVIDPLEILSDQAKRITAGDYLYTYSQPVTPDAYAEVNLLMDSFKTMEDAVRTRENDNYKLLFDVQRHLRQERLLRDIDSAITSIENLEHTLKAILTRINTRLGIDASSIYLSESGTSQLTCAYRIGFLRNPDRSAVAAFEKFISKAAEESKLIRTPNLEKAKGQLFKTIHRTEKLRSYIGIPLYAREQLIGYMNLFTRSIYSPAEDEVDFLKLVGLHTALAIDSTRMFTDLQLSNLEMARAYDSTLEGWSRAMDLRDRETEGHTLRVTELTEKLARQLGIPEEAMIHVRRGSLLHDIGKIGVPDSILLKPGPLTSKEWEIMRQHPLHAHAFLTAIDYLRPSLDIPLRHHEHWDGSGYPDRLAGEDIPLAARIFSVVDVWDALTSDRPYRAAWSPEKALAYIRQQSGRYFDPAVVQEFFKLIQAGSADQPAEPGQES